ncbi:MAG: ribosome maturation factor RimP [Alphaproteobacteria bacterium]|nr:ribosome maturation factor RimP [Alphaproteobacteria bacterium]
MAAITQLENLIAPSLEDMGYEIVRIQMSGKERVVVQIMIDRLDEKQIDVEDCATVSRAVSAILDVEDPIEKAYTLEVSSPGIDRPLVRQRDYKRFAGFEAKVELKYAVDGQRRFRGKLLGAVDDDIHLEIEHGGEMVEIALPFDDIDKAKLVMSDALIEASKKAQGVPDDEAAENEAEG